MVCGGETKIARGGRWLSSAITFANATGKKCKANMVLRKFMPIKDYVLKNIVNQQLAYSSPELFNDPYDACLLHDEDFLSFLKEDEKDFLKRIRIACLFKTIEKGKKSEDGSTYEEILRYFWSFYGDSHRGLCIEFEIPETEFKREFLASGKFYDLDFTEGDFDFKKQQFISKKARYESDILTKIKYIKNSTNKTNLKDVLDKVIFLKDSIFIRESEYRFATVCRKDKMDDFIPFSIKDYNNKKIIFGSKCDPSLQKLITAYAKDYYNVFITTNDMEEREYEI